MKRVGLSIEGKIRMAGSKMCKSRIPILLIDFYKKIFYLFYNLNELKTRRFNLFL